MGTGECLYTQICKGMSTLTKGVSQKWARENVYAPTFVKAEHCGRLLAITIIIINYYASAIRQINSFDS